jgi:hypothetical protein
VILKLNYSNRTTAADLCLKQTAGATSSLHSLHCCCILVELKKMQSLECIVHSTLLPCWHVGKLIY